MFSSKKETDACAGKAVVARFDYMILEILKVVDKPTWEKEAFLFEEIRETLSILSNKMRRNVYENANGRCECCGLPLKMDQGDFHLFNHFNQRNGPLKIQFLCPTDHRIHGHTFRNGKIRGQQVGKHESPYWRVSSMCETPSRR